MMARATFWCLLIVATGLASIGSAFGQGPSEPAKGTATRGACQHLLPVEVSRTLSQQFSGWTVQSPDALISAARERWRAEKPLGCPGIASGRFTSAKSVSFAVLVVGGGENREEAKLLVFVGAGASFHVAVLDRISSGASNHFIHGTKVHQFFDVVSARPFRVASTDSIVLFKCRHRRVRCGYLLLDRRELSKRARGLLTLGASVTYNQHALPEAPVYGKCGV